MRETEYTYAVAYTRTLENKMLKKTDMEMLINCNNIKSVEEFLIEKGYGSSNDYKKNIYDILKDEMIKIYNEIKFAVPRNSKIEMFLYPNDFHNLKTILKAVFSNTQWESVILEPYNVDPKLIFDAISTNQYNLLPEFIRQSAINAYEVLAKTQDGQLIEVMLDKDLFIILKDKAKEFNNKFLIDLLEIDIMIINMKIALRAAKNKQNYSFLKSAFIPCESINVSKLLDAAMNSYSEVINVIEQSGFKEAANAVSESMISFEKWCDNKKIEKLKSIKNNSFGISPVIAFLIGKKNEIMCIRLIISGINSGIKKDLIRERLRDLYV